MPVTAGILSIVSGASAIIGGIIIATLFSVISGIGGPGLPSGEARIVAWLGVLGIPLIILGIVAIVGGVFAIRRKVWGMALAGAICSLTSLILGILSIIFVSISKKEFV